MTVNMPGPPVAQKPAAGRKTLWIIAAAAVIVLLVCLFAVRFTAGGGGSVDTPTGLTTSADRDGEGVSAAWTGVGGADSYQLVRDEETVVYEGDATTYTDKEASTGKHRYTVRALADGVMSAPSTASEVTVGSSWGRYQPFVSQFPELLPQTPSATGWRRIECAWYLNGFEAEMGTGDAGSGTILGRARLGCYGPEVAVSIGWLESTQAVDTIFAGASKKPGAEAVKWRYGTGYFIPSGPAMHLRPDLEGKNLWIAIAAKGATKEDLLDFANDLPLE